MKKEFLFNLLLLVLINVMIKPLFIFGIDLGVQNRAPEGEYGRYFALLFVAYLFQIITDFGIQNFNNRHVSQHPHLMAKYFPNLLALKLVLSFAYLIITPLLALLLFRYQVEDMPLLLVLLFNQALIQLTFFLRSNVSGLGHYRLDSLLSSADKLLMLFTCGALLWFSPQTAPFSLMQFALAQTVALVLTSMLVLLALRRKATFSLKPSWAGRWREGRRMMFWLWRKSLPYALVILLMSAYTRLDAVLLERLLPDGRLHADVYAGAYRLLDAANMLGYLFASLLLPMFAKQLRHDPSGQGSRPLVALSFRLIWAGSLSLALAVSFARQDIIQLMMPERANIYRWDILGLLIWAFVPVCTTYIFSTLLTAHERLMQMNRFFLIAIVLNLALNFILIPRFEAYGAVISTLSTQCFVALAMIGLCMRTFRYRPSAKGIVQISLYTAWAVLGAWLIWGQSELAWSWRFVLMLSNGVFGLLFFAEKGMLGKIAGLRK